MTFMQKLKAGLLLALTVSVPSASATDFNAMTKAEKAQFGAQIREYLLENPEVVMEALTILQDRQQQAEQEQDTLLVQHYINDIQNDSISWVGGNPEGDITMVEFLDYRCGYCRRAHSDVDDLVKSDGNIRLIVKEYPILSEDSLLLARAAVATLQHHGPEAYKKIHDAFITYNGPVTAEAILFLAQQSDLDGTAIVQNMDTDNVSAHLTTIQQLGQNLHVSGTPTFIFNDQIIRGYIPLDAMKEIVADLRAQAVK